MLSSVSTLPALPRLPPQHLPRPRLHDLLLREDRRLRLLLAAPGSGKTVLLGECARAAPATTQVVWLALGGRALDAAAFIARLGQALDLDGADEQRLGQCLYERRQPLWIMLDDYPREPDAVLDACLDRLLAHASPQVGWWLASRRRPACNLARLLLEGELLEIEGACLNFSESELADWLLLGGRTWPEEARRTLLEQTGGWCAGMRLRLLGIAPDDPAPAAALLADAGRPLLQEYLQREVLDELPEPLAEALCSLARIGRCCAALADHLFDETPGMLQALQQRGACLVAEEGACGWYQVVPALAGELAELGRTPACSLHRRACQWFGQAGDIHAAFEHSLRAGQPDVAASLLQRLTEEHLLQGHNVARVLQLREKLPAELLLSTPRLVILNAWALLFAGRLDEAEQLLGAFARFLPMPGAERQRALLAQWLCLAGMLAHLRGQPEAAERLRDALADLPTEAWAQTLIGLSALSQLAQAAGQLDQARLLNREALKRAREQGSLVFEAYLEMDRAFWLEQRGELLRAEALLRRVQESLAELRQAGYAMTGRVLLRRGWLCLRQGQNELARDLLQVGLREARRSLDPSAVYGHIGLALLDARDGELDCAFTRLLEAERQMQLQHIPESLYRGTLLLASGVLTLRQGRPSQAREVLGRVLARYQGGGLNAPAATPDLVARVACQLALAQCYAGEPQQALARLDALLPVLLEQGRMGLVTEVWLAKAEAHGIAGDLPAAHAARDTGIELAQRFGLLAPLSESRQRQPELFALSAAAELPPLLSHREQSVLELIACGCSNLEIGERLFISLHTVKTHARRINGKLGVERRTQAVARAKELGLLKA